MATRSSAQSAIDALGLPDDDPTRGASVRLTNPLSDEEPFLHPRCCSGSARRCAATSGAASPTSRIFDLAPVFLARRTQPRSRRDRRSTQRPTDEEIAELIALLPEQPLHVAGLMVGDAERPGWWGDGRPVEWADAVQAARTVAGALRADVRVRAAQHAPWHPGRCAELSLASGTSSAGPASCTRRACAALGLPPRTVAFELDLDVLRAGAPGLVTAGKLRTYPLAKEDVALVVDESVAAADVEAALRAGAGDLLESIRLFDVYRDAGAAGARAEVACLRAPFPRGRPHPDGGGDRCGARRGRRGGGPSARRHATHVGSTQPGATPGFRGAMVLTFTDRRGRDEDQGGWCGGSGCAARGAAPRDDGRGAPG